MDKTTIGPADVLEKLQTILRPVGQKSGRVLYSGMDTLVPGQLYLMGINPGGEARDVESETIGATLKETRQKWNDYADGRESDEAWTPMQLRVRNLFRVFELDPQCTLTTNAIFLRSPGEADIPDPWNNWWDYCWPAHQLMLSVVRPKLIVCLGDLPLQALRAPSRPNEKGRYARPRWEPLIDLNEGAGSLFSVTLDLGDAGHALECMVLALPHPMARGMWSNNQLSDVMREAVLDAKQRLDGR